MILENGNSFSTAKATFFLKSLSGYFEARLNGYKAQFENISEENAERAINSVERFERLALDFLTDGIPSCFQLTMNRWLAMDDAEQVDAFADRFKQIFWHSASQDPFDIGSDLTDVGVKCNCRSEKDGWSVGILLERSILPNTDFFVQISGSYEAKSTVDTFELKVDHLRSIYESVKLKLMSELTI